jgi:hypothetical protein
MLWASLPRDLRGAMRISGPIWCNAYVPRQKRAYRLTVAHNLQCAVAVWPLRQTGVARGYRACGQAGRYDFLWGQPERKPELCLME